MAYVGRDLFVAYETIRRTGKFNMIMDGVIVARILGCTRDQYIFMLKDYRNLYNQFINN